MHLVQHGADVFTRVVEEFEAKDIGTPFKVILHNSVKVSVDKLTGDEVSYRIPDLDGLLGAVLIVRILHPRKLSGGDIKFLRKVLGLKQKALAEQIEVTVEHLSRCETGALPMSPGTEKLLRVFALKSALKLDGLKSGVKKTQLEDALDRLFESVRSVAAFDVKDELVLHFHRVSPSKSKAGPEDADGGLWDERKAAA